MELRPVGQSYTRYRQTCDSLGRAAITPAWHSSNSQGKRVLPEMSTAEEHVTLGNALAARGDLEGAIAEYRAALHIDPNLAETHFNLGLAL
jgi:Flp pilus assembly protein TadD